MKYIYRKKYLRFIAAIVDAAGDFLFRRRDLRIPEPSAVLIVRLDHMGDVLSATGIPQGLKGRYPTARVVFLTSSIGKSLLENNPYVDEIIVYDAPWFRRSGALRENNSFWKIVEELKRRHFDLGLSLRGDARENLLLFLARVRFRVGYGITGLGFLLHRVLTYRQDDPETQHSLDVLNALGIRLDVLLPALYFSEDENLRIKRLLIESVGKTVVGVQFDAGSKAKTWPESNRASFLEDVFRRFPEAQFLFVGTDPVMASWLDKRLLGTSAVNLVGKTALRELLIRLKSCNFFIGPDSGPSHLAAALGVPTLFIYSGTNLFEKWRSLSDNTDFLRNPVPCSPCHLTECVVEGHPCMSGIQPERIFSWLKERLHAE